MDHSIRRLFICLALLQPIWTPAQDLVIADVFTYGSADDDFALGVSASSAPDSIFFCGENYSELMIDGEGGTTFTVPGDGFSDAFVARYTIGSDYIDDLHILGGDGQQVGPTVKHLAMGNALVTTAVKGTTTFDTVSSGTITVTTTPYREDGLQYTFDPFIGKMNSFGQYEWFDIPVSDLSNFAKTAEITPDGSALVIGISRGDLIFNAGKPSELILPPAIDDSFDSWIAKYSDDGTIQWLRLLGGTLEDSIEKISVFEDGSFVAAGFYRETFFINEGLTDQVTYVSEGEEDIFVGKWNADGSLVWTTTIGSPSNDRCYSVLALEGGDCLITGGYGENCDFPMSDGSTFTPSIMRGFDAYVARLDGTSGRANWVKTLNSDGIVDYGVALATSPSSTKFYAAFQYEDTLFTDGAFLETHGAGTDVLIATMDPETGEISGKVSLLGPGNDNIYSMATLGSNRLITAGTYSNDAVIEDGMNFRFLNTVGGLDAYVITFDIRGDILNSTMWGFY